MNSDSVFPVLIRIRAPSNRSTSLMEVRVLELIFRKMCQGPGVTYSKYVTTFPGNEAEN